MVKTDTEGIWKDLYIEKNKSWVLTKLQGSENYRGQSKKLIVEMVKWLEIWKLSYVLKLR